MAISPIDWAIVAAYFVFCTVIGLYFTRRGGKSLSEYYADITTALEVIGAPIGNR